MQLPILLVTVINDRTRTPMPLLCVRLLLLIVAGFALPAISQTDSLDKQAEKLKQVQQQIKAQRLLINESLASKRDIEDEFKATELEVAELALQLQQTQMALDSVNQRIDELNLKKDELVQQKRGHQKVLAELVRSAYLTGQHDYTKLLLNQDSPAKLERLISYYKSLNDARAEQLEEIKSVLDSLQQVEADLQTQLSKVESLLANQKTERAALNQAQAERKKSLTKLTASIRNTEDSLKQLQADEKRIADAIDRARQVAERNPSSLPGLYNLKKKLKWPVAGKLVHTFGQHRSGSLRWKGVMLSDELGTPVQAIADGIVIYADWLRGFGWLSVVDHGKGYMSLYGHNQALLKGVGDYVEQGEPIALLGQSGGQSQPSLYFEIRYQGKTVNPARWCK